MVHTGWCARRTPPYWVRQLQNPFELLRLARLFELPGFIFAHLRQGLFTRKSLKGEFFLGERPGLLGFALRCILLLSWCFNKTSSSNRRDDEGHYCLSMQVFSPQHKSRFSSSTAWSDTQTEKLPLEIHSKVGRLTATSVKDMSLTCNMFHGALQTACGYRIRRWGITTSSRSITPWFSIWWSPLASFILVFQRTTLLYQQFAPSL